jgi:hypothetical protein
MRIREMGLNPDVYGWVSVQLDGGVRSTLAKIEAWFMAELDQIGGAPQQIGLERLTLGLTSFGPLPPGAAQGLAAFVRRCLASGGRCVLSSNASLLPGGAFTRELGIPETIRPNLPYGGRPEAPGLYLMQVPSSHGAETLAGLGAAGAHAIVAYSDARPVHAHPFIPVIRIGANVASGESHELDLRLEIDSPPSRAASSMMERVLDVLTGKYVPIAQEHGDFQFQLARGPQGLSL